MSRHRSPKFAKAGLALDEIESRAVRDEVRFGPIRIGELHGSQYAGRRHWPCQNISKNGRYGDERHGSHRLSSCANARRARVWRSACSAFRWRRSNAPDRPDSVSRLNRFRSARNSAAVW